MLSVAHQQGHLYVELNDLKTKTTELLELTQEHETVIKEALHTLYNKDKIRLITENENHYITLTSSYFSEKGVALRTKNLLARPSPHQFPLTKYI